MRPAQIGEDHRRPWQGMRDFCLRARTKKKQCGQRHWAPELGIASYEGGWSDMVNLNLVDGAPVDEGLPASGLAYLVVYGLGGVG